MSHTTPHKPYQNVREDECFICLEILEGEIAEVSCGHIFHYHCIQDWIKKKGSHRSCCICEQNTEIVNIVNFENPKPFQIRNKKKNKQNKKICNCCQIL